MCSKSKRTNKIPQAQVEASGDNKKSKENTQPNSKFFHKMELAPQYCMDETQFFNYKTITRPGDTHKRFVDSKNGSVPFYLPSIKCINVCINPIADSESTSATEQGKSSGKFNTFGSKYVAGNRKNTAAFSSPLNRSEHRHDAGGFPRSVFTTMSGGGNTSTKTVYSYSQYKPRPHLGSMWHHQPRALLSSSALAHSAEYVTESSPSTQDTEPLCTSTPVKQAKPTANSHIVAPLWPVNSRNPILGVGQEPEVTRSTDLETEVGWWNNLSRLELFEPTCGTHLGSGPDYPFNVYPVDLLGKPEYLRKRFM